MFCQSAFHLGNGPLMVLMPIAHRGNHDIGVRKKAIHSGLGGSGSVANELLARPLDGLARESLDRLVRHGNEESAALFQFDGKRERLDFDQALSPADLQLSAG